MISPFEIFSFLYCSFDHSNGGECRLMNVLPHKVTKCIVYIYINITQLLQSEIDVIIIPKIIDVVSLNTIYSCFSRCCIHCLNCLTFR